MKPHLKLADLPDIPHYWSIINLTRHYQFREKGLQRIHYRWALIPNHDGIKDTASVAKMTKFFSPRYTKEEWEPIHKRFLKGVDDTRKRLGITKKEWEKIEKAYPFPSSTNIAESPTPPDLQDYYRIDIEKDCINGKYASNNLTNFLRVLCDPGNFNILKKRLGKDGVERYILPDYSKLQMIWYARSIIGLLDNWIRRGENEKIARLVVEAAKLILVIEMKE